MKKNNAIANAAQGKDCRSSRASKTRAGSQKVHKRTSTFSVPSIPGQSSIDRPVEWYEIMQEERALLAQERKYPNNVYFKMGAAVAISGLFDLGKLGRKSQVAGETRRFLRSFGIRNMEDVRALGVKGACLSDLEELYAL